MSRVSGIRRAESRRPGDKRGGEAAVTEWRAAWAAALDELERDVHRAESLLSDTWASAAVPPAPRPSPTELLSPLPTQASVASGWALRRYGVTAAATDMPMAALESGTAPVLSDGVLSDGVLSGEVLSGEVLEGELLDMSVESAAVAGAEAENFGQAWTPPDLGPLPDDLRDRASALLNRQLVAAEALSKAMLGSQQHLGLLDRLKGGADEPRSAYLDQSC